MERKYLSVAELAETTGLSKATISRRIKDGSIPAGRVGNRLLIPADWRPKPEPSPAAKQK